MTWLIDFRKSRSMYANYSGRTTCSFNKQLISRGDLTSHSGDAMPLCNIFWYAITSPTSRIHMCQESPDYIGWLNSRRWLSWPRITSVKIFSLSRPKIESICGRPAFVTRTSSISVMSALFVFRVSASYFSVDLVVLSPRSLTPTMR